MSKDGLLPSGVEYHHIPGNRPEDVAFDKAAEQVTEYDMQAACEDYREAPCKKAKWRDCAACKGTGVYEAHSTDCSKCGGSGKVFDGCTIHVVDVTGCVEDNGHWSECEIWEDIIISKMQKGEDDE